MQEYITVQIRLPLSKSKQFARFVMLKHMTPQEYILDLLSKNINYPRSIMSYPELSDIVKLTNDINTQNRNFIIESTKEKLVTLEFTIPANLYNTYESILTLLDTNFNSYILHHIIEQTNFPNQNLLLDGEIRRIIREIQEKSPKSQNSNLNDHLKGSKEGNASLYHLSLKGIKSQRN